MFCFLSLLPQLLSHHILSSPPPLTSLMAWIKIRGELRRGFKEEHLGKLKKRKKMSFFFPFQLSDHLFAFTVSTCCSSCLLRPFIGFLLSFSYMGILYVSDTYLLAFNVVTLPPSFLHLFCGVKMCELVLQEKERLRIRITWITCYI